MEPLTQKNAAHHISKKTFETLFRQYFKLVFNTINRIIENHQESETLAQSVFLELWNKKNNSVFSSIAPNHYLLKKAVSKAYQYLKSIKDVTVGLSDMERQSFVFHALDNLPEDCKKVFLMSRQSQMSYAMIADQLGISHIQVETHITNAIHHIRAELKAIKKYHYSRLQTN